MDKQALPKPEAPMLAASDYEEPVTPTEQRLSRLWKEVLRVERAGAGDHFFELGGHSLRATFLAAKIHEEFEAEIPVRDIFAYPTLRELASRIDEAGGSPYRPITVLEKREYYALSSAQKRMFVLHELEDGGLSYNMPAALTIEGDADLPRIEAAMRSLIVRHESLRTSFKLVDGEPMQKISQAVPFSLGSIEIEDQMFDAHMENNFVRPFDLMQAPLFRAEMVKLASGSQVLLLDMHHIISDGISQGLLIRDFVRLYNGESLPELKIQYKEFAAWQNEELASATMERQKAYWLQVFDGEIPVLNLQTDFPRPSTRQFEGGMVTFELEAEELALLKELAATEGTTLYMVLLAAYTALLYKYTGQEDIVIGTPIAGRRHRNLEETMGMFVNTLAMRNRPQGEKTFRVLLQEVREQTLLAYENQDYQFEELVDKLNIRRDMSRNPLFDVMLVLQNTEQAEMSAEGVSFKRREITARTSKFDLLLHVAEEGQGLRLDFEYSAALFKRETIERLSGHLLQALREIVADPEQRLADLEIIDPQEKRTILEEFNGPQQEYPREMTIGRLFERQAEETPDRIAVVHGTSRLTYRELNE
ncbi:condensation domain-containing protein, partial [Paenibacillus dendritiformis]|uniref:condensation domain-containing protein n=1 Tax=Paenibacillus dendritiformis TaxID=130049 RepID=UPI00387E0A3D